MEKSYIAVLVTSVDKQQAENIVERLLEEKLIACANIVGPVNSRFCWEGKIEHAEEYLVLMKSRFDLFNEVANRVKQLHSYEVPEVIALPIVLGLKEYVNWLGSCLKQHSSNVHLCTKKP